MDIMIYISIGIIFTFIIESMTTHTDLVKDKPNFGFSERLLSIFLWPVFLVVFLYNFFKAYFK